MGFADLLADVPAFVAFTFWITVWLLVLIGGILLAIVFLRLSDLRDSATRARVAENWSPIFNAARHHIPISTPDMPASEAPFVLELWTEHRGISDDSLGERFLELALEVGLDKSIVKLLDEDPWNPGKVPAWQRTLAMRAGRWIDTPQVRRMLHHMTRADSQALAIQACETLLQLGDRDCLKQVLSLLLSNPNHAPTITSRLGNAGGAMVIKAIDPFIELLPRNVFSNFMEVLERSKDRSLMPILRDRLAKPGNDEEIASLLKAVARLGSSNERDLVIPFLSNPQTFVRIQATRALTRIGLPQDRELLIPLLSDPEWWLRYRAAQAFVALCKGDKELVEIVRDSVTDRFARDILDHAFMEQGWFRT